MADKFVVPPGHKVVVVHPAPKPQFFRLESGTLVADLTAAKESEGVFAAAWKQLSTDKTATVLWIVQESVLTDLTAEIGTLSHWLWRLYLVRPGRGTDAPSGGDVAVVFGTGAPTRLMMALLGSLGFAVYHPGPDGSVFIEVHRPDGIVVGMPGAKFEGGSGRQLTHLYREREEAGRTQVTALGLRAIHARVLALIKSLMEEMGIVASRGLPELVSLLADEPTARNREAFYRALLAGKVSVRNPDPPRSIPTAKASDGSPLLLVSCDAPGLLAIHPHDVLMEISGRDVLEMARGAGGGVIVKNELDWKDSWAAVPKEHVAAVLDGRFH